MSVSAAAPPSERATVRRRAGRARYDRQTVNAILDEGLIGHVGISVDGQPFVLPVVYARAGDEVLLHGSPLSRLVGGLADGLPMSFTVTLVDALVLARSAFHHSVNYRSVVVLGCGRLVDGAVEKRVALEAIVSHAVPGRAEAVRAPADAELAATEVVALPLREASAKVRTGPPVDAPEDYALPVWAGELPLGLAIGPPVTDPRCELPVPEHVNAYSRRRA